MPGTPFRNSLLRNLIAAASAMAATTTFAAADPDDSSSQDGACAKSAPPPPAVDASEAPKPGQSVPRPLPATGNTDLGSCGVVQPEGSAPLPEGAAPAWLVADLGTGQVLAARDAHGRYRPASTIKTLLALVVLNELDTGQSITETNADEIADRESVEKFIRPGAVHTVYELLEALLMVSSNGAANALADALGGVGPAVAKMNAEAASLGAHDTRAATPSGLDAPGMSTSPYDLALIFRAALRNPTFAKIVGQDSATVSGSPSIKLLNRDPLIDTYPGILGGKTGFTDDAQHNFVAAAERDGRRLVVAVMDNPGEYPSGQAATLLDWGFELEPGLGVGPLG